MNLKAFYFAVTAAWLAAFLLSGNLTVYTQENAQEQQSGAAGTGKEQSLALKSDITVPESIAIEYEHRSFLSLANSSAYAAAVKKEDDKDYLRAQWKEMLGMDVFMPYFKARDVEDWVKEKAHMNFFKMKGEPKFNKNRVQYMFDVKF